MTTPRQDRPSSDRLKSTLSARDRVLLEIVHDFLPDQSGATSLKQALEKGEPLDMIRMLAQQWSLGMSTLQGDQEQQHQRYVKVSLAAHFIEALKQALDGDKTLLAEQNAATLREAMQGHLRKNRPVLAAWCAAKLWEQREKL